METVFGILLGLFILVLLVVAHEFGHAFAARKSGVVVEEFGIGFPPRAWSKKLKNKVLFSVNWLPLGGFVKLQGEHDEAIKKGDYGAAPLKSKAVILLAGVVANWLIAVVLFSILAVVGLPKIIDNQFVVSSDVKTQLGQVTIVSLKEDYPAVKAGIQKSDKILSVDGVNIASTKQFIDITKQNAGKTINVLIERGNSEFNQNVELLSDSQNSVFGANLGQSEKLKSTWSAPIVGLAITWQLTVETLKGLGSLVGNVASGIVMQLSFDQSVRDSASQKLGTAGDSVAGPIGILGVLFPDASRMGVETVLLLTAIISLTLAVMNILPIPALDGGRLFVTLLFRAMKKPLTKETEEKIHGTGFAILMGLVVVITFLDILKLFR